MISRYKYIFGLLPSLSIVGCRAVLAGSLWDFEAQRLSAQTSCQMLRSLQGPKMRGRLIGDPQYQQYIIAQMRAGDL